MTEYMHIQLTIISIQLLGLILMFGQMANLPSRSQGQLVQSTTYIPPFLHPAAHLLRVALNQLMNPPPGLLLLVKSVWSLHVCIKIVESLLPDTVPR